MADSGLDGIAFPFEVKRVWHFCSALRAVLNARNLFEGGRFHSLDYSEEVFVNRLPSYGTAPKAEQKWHIFGCSNA